MSTIDSSGLVGVSTQTILVASGHATPPSRSRSPMGRRAEPDPGRAVDPRDQAVGPPVGIVGQEDDDRRRRSSRSTASSPASPLAKATPWVGALEGGQALLEGGAGRVAAAAVLVALVAPDRRPGRRWMSGRSACTTAPVVGSGSWPAWMARVSKPRPDRRSRG